MAGSQHAYVYTDDAGNTWSVRMPDWEATVTDHGATLSQTHTLATTQSPLPPGTRRRKRYYRITATGKEGSFTVLETTSNLWTSPKGTPILIPLFNAALAGADNATLQGRTGERMKAI
jgi:hypothetical protein